MKPWEELGMPPPKSEASGGRLSLKDYEVYSGVEVPEEWLVVRLDGWGFHGLAKKLRFKKPFDFSVASAIASAAKSFFLPFNPALAYCFSDEINLVFKKISLRRVEKIDSIFASLASVSFQKALGKACFDCRCIPLRKKELVIKYLVWRQAECFRNHNNAWAQYLLQKKEKLSPRAASKRLTGMKTEELFKLCKEKRLDLKKTPGWQRLGYALLWERFKKKGYNPIKKKKVTVERRRVKLEFNLPRFNSLKGKKWLEKVLNENV